jgi:hypothetical protein
MDDTQLARLADAGHALRPDWPTKSLHTFLAKNFATKAYRDVAIALAYIATVDPPTDTPQLLLKTGPWWTATAATRSEAARHPSSVAYGDLCQTHGTHRDACPPNCNPHAAAARRRNAAERNTHWAAIARKTLRQETP